MNNCPMNIEQQRTPEWHAQRVGRVTGSRAGAILGLSPWQTSADVLRAMVREYHDAESEFTDNPATAHGRYLERRAVLAFMKRAGEYVENCGFFARGEWLGASPDGLTADGGILEIKVPLNLRNGGEFKPLAKQPHYYAQVQLEMLCSGRDHGYFAQYIATAGDPFGPDYTPEAMHVERIGIDRPWLAGALPKLRAFWRLYQSELDNTAHLEPLRVTIDTDAAKRIIERMGAIDDALHNLDAERKDLLKQLVTMAGERDALICGRKLTRTKDSASVAYAKALKELAPGADLAPWTTKKPGYWRLS
jgi:putative phage-type endonuclease